MAVEIGLQSGQTVYVVAMDMNVHTNMSRREYLVLKCVYCKVGSDVVLLRKMGSGLVQSVEIVRDTCGQPAATREEAIASHRIYLEMRHADAVEHAGKLR